MIAMIGGFLAKSALMRSPIGGFLKMIPRWAWIALAGAVLVLLAVWWHAGKKDAFGDARYQAGYSARDAEITKLQREREAADRKLAEEIRRRVNAENARIAADANALRLRGPGRATCPNPPRPGPGAGGHDAAAAGADAARPALPAGEWAAVPWNWLVRRAEEFDRLLTEAKAWREQKAAEIAAHDRSREGVAEER